MIVIKLSGGLGNQLFQYAFGMYLAETKNVKVVFDKSWYDRNRDRHLTIQNIYKQIEFANKYQIAKILYPNNAFLYALSLLSRLVWKGSHLFITEKKPFEFDSELYDKIPESCYLDGYWQNENYFIKIREILLNSINTELESAHDHMQYLNKIKNSNSVCLHVRRGDYVKLKMDNICNLSYFNKAIKMVKNKVTNPVFFIFSDDFKFAQDNFSSEGMILVPTNDKAPEADLVLMSHCKNQITSNSSFSWWASWLNKNDNKIVITPLKWNNGDAEKSPSPHRWIKVNNI